ncbi:hypothetical protein BJ912DRAFT_967100, partial [Pholiota molesta]
MMKKGGKTAAEEAPEPEPEQEPEPEPAPPVTPAKSKLASSLAAAKFANDDADEDAYGDANANEDDTEMFSSAHASMSFSKSRALPSVGGRRRLDSLSQSTASGGWDSESASASTPRPPPKVPAHLQEVAAAMSAPPPFGLKPLMQAQAENRPGTGMGTIRPRAGSSATGWGAATNANANGTATGQNGGGRSLWGLFGGGGSAGGDAAPAAAPKAQADMWVPGGFERAEDENGAGAEGVDDGGGGGGDGGGGESGGWMAMSNNGRSQADKMQSQQPVSLAQRLRRGSEATAPSPAPRAGGKGAAVAAAAPAAPTPAASAAASKKGRAKKGAKGKKVTIEDVPDEEVDNRGEVLPVDSRLIFDDAQVILEPKPSVPPALFDSIISYTDEEDNKPAQARAPSNSPPADAWGNDRWMSAAAKDIQEGTSKMEKASVGGGVWGAGSNNAAKRTWGPTAAGASEDVEDQGPPFFSSLSGGGGRAGKTTQQTAGGGGVWGQKGKGKLTADSAGGDEAGNGAAKPTIQNLKRNKAAGG